MDVSGWTIEQRMRFPDWCFGNRKMLSVLAVGDVVGGLRWFISTEACPDPACIWKFGSFVISNDGAFNWIRVGLSNTLPTSSPEMDATRNIFPSWGNDIVAPPRQTVPLQAGADFNLDLRMGLVTGGEKLVVETKLNAAAAQMRAMVYLIVSGLPTSMAGWLAHEKV